MSITISSNMNLPIPGVGTEAGPTYASDINNCLTLIDQHDHSAGYGVPITPSGININSDLTLGNNNLIAIKSSRFQVQSVAIPATGSNLDCLYVTGVDLYYNDGSGNQVRITQSGAVAGTPGSIANLVSPASASYVSANSTFVFQSAANTPANLDGAALVLRNLSASSKGLTLSPPAAMGADYGITLPSLPGVQNILTMDASGAVAASWNVDNSTLQVASNTIKIKDAGVTSAKLASNLNLPGDAVQEDGKNIAVSNTNATKSLAIIRARISGTTVSSGEGVTVAHPGAGHYTITFDEAFGDVPTVCANVENPSNAYIAQYGNLFTTSVDIFINDSAGNPTDNGFSIIIIGQRA